MPPGLSRIRANTRRSPNLKIHKPPQLRAQVSAQAVAAVSMRANAEPPSCIEPVVLTKAQSGVTGSISVLPSDSRFTGVGMKGRAIFLDRDGVLNDVILRDGRPYSPASVEEVIIPDGVHKVCEKLRSHGFLLVVVTNQPDVARGVQDRQVVDDIHAFLRSRLPLDDIRVCYHDDDDECDCRKPKPGLLLAAARVWDIDLARSFMVGDRWRDIEAGRAAGCRTIFINRNYQERRPEGMEFETDSLAKAVEWILSLEDVNRDL